jgi:hypothetical protein
MSSLVSIIKRREMSTSPAFAKWPDQSDWTSPTSVAVWMPNPLLDLYSQKLVSSFDGQTEPDFSLSGHTSPSVISEAAPSFRLVYGNPWFSVRHF